MDVKSRPRFLHPRHDLVAARDLVVLEQLEGILVNQTLNFDCCSFLFLGDRHCFFDCSAEGVKGVRNYFGVEVCRVPVEEGLNVGEDGFEFVLLEL